MIRRITLENYMSHVLTVIEPAAGLTVLCGPNNCGKSAVVSAIQTICGENDGDFMVRHGEKIARVTIETDDGHTITWQRKGKAPSYNIDGTDIHRIGRGNLPDGLHDLLKLPNVETANDKRFPVHFGLQKEPIFLLNSESDTAAFFSTSAEAERLLEMQKRHKSNTTSARGEQKTVNADIKRLDERLTALAPLDEITPAVKAVEAEYAACLESQKQADELAARIDAIIAAGQRVVAMNAQVEALAPLKSPPVLADASPLERIIGAIVRRDAERQQELRRCDALADLTAPPPQSEIAPLQKLIAGMQRTADQLTAWQARAAATEPLREPPTPIDLKPLVAIGRKLKSLKGEVDSASAQLAALSGLKEPPAIADLAPMTTAVTKADRAAKQLEKCRSDVATAEKNVAQIERQIVDFVTSHPVCPTCGSTMDAEHLIHGGAHE
jgi:exonuclease SbcC